LQVSRPFAARKKKNGSATIPTSLQKKFGGRIYERPRRKRKGKGLSSTQTQRRLEIKYTLGLAVPCLRRDGKKRGRLTVQRPGALPKELVK